MDYLVVFAHPNRKFMPLTETTPTTQHKQQHNHHHHTCELLLIGQVGVTEDDNNSNNWTQYELKWCYSLFWLRSVFLSISCSTNFSFSRLFLLITTLSNCWPLPWHGIPPNLQATVCRGRWGRWQEKNDRGMTRRMRNYEDWTMMTNLGQQWPGTMTSRDNVNRGWQPLGTTMSWDNDNNGVQGTMMMGDNDGGQKQPGTTTIMGQQQQQQQQLGMTTTGDDNNRGWQQQGMTTTGDDNN